jgi:ribosomal protein L44E
MADYTRLRTPFTNMNQTDVVNLFDYKDGNLLWKMDKAKGKIKAGSVAGGITSKGYMRVTINYKEYPLHRIIFLLHHGYCPNVVDHINGNVLDNRIENLREATDQTNQYNRKRGLNNKSGCKNVSWNKASNAWQVHIRCNKKVKSWYVKDFELAELVAYEARSLYHGSFANHD